MAEIASSRISIEESAERVKITIPLRRLWLYWAVYTVVLLVWVASTFWAIQTIFNYGRVGNLGFEGAFLILWIVILLMIGLFWIWVGRQIWNKWQFYSSNREILFFHNDKLIVRRPLSILGITDAYDISHVSPFRYDSYIDGVAFDYGPYRVPVGPTLETDEAKALVQLINTRFFPDAVGFDDEDEDDE